MAEPVVVSRIQNRRGLQADFNALYPPGYQGTGGFESSSNPVTTYALQTSVTNVTFTGTDVTYHFASSNPLLIPVNSQILVQNVVSIPANVFNNTFTTLYYVTASSSTSVTIASLATATSVTPGTGTIYFIYNSNNYT